jgi:nicotinate-nucleotide adenylyltransferase
MPAAATKFEPEVEPLPQRVAFFGGSFDPPHAGHLAIARAARKALHLGRVLFAPVGVQPLKLAGLCTASSFEDRLAMIQIAIEGEQGFEISTLDAPVEGGKPNFTAETLEKLKALLGANSALFCLMGADSFLQLGRWHRAGELPFLAELIVAARPGEVLEPIEQHLPPGVELVSGPLILEQGQLQQWTVSDGEARRAAIMVMPDLDYEISATDLRKAIQVGEPRLLKGEELVSKKVLNYIQAHKLYQ